MLEALLIVALIVVKIAAKLGTIDQKSILFTNWMYNDLTVGIKVVRELLIDRSELN